MIPIGLQLFESPGGSLLANFSNVQACLPQTGEHGFRSLTCFVPMSLYERFIYYSQAPGKHLSLNYGSGVVWEGRVEDRAIVGGGLRITAMGYWRAMFDAPYTALWSASGTSGWGAVSDDNISTVTPEKFEADNNNRLYAAPRQAESQSNSDGFAWTLTAPDGGSRDIVGIQFDYEINTSSTTWILRVDRWTNDFSYQSTEATLNGNSSGSINLAFSGSEMILLLFRYDSASPVTPTGDTGSAFVKITNIRVVTSTANRVNTTTTTTISAGSQVVTPVDMSRIYVGQRLFIDAGLATSESVTVTAITATTFTATFANSYSGTTTIQAHVVYADEIVKDLVSHVSGINSSQLNSSVALVESPGLDLLDEVYEDTWPGDICRKLAKLGDDQTPPRQWEVGVWEEQRLHFRPCGSAGRTWSVDVDVLDVESSLETLINSAYAVYQDGNNDVKRTAVANDASSQSKYGIVRRAAVGAQTTSSTQAGVVRDAFLADGATIRPRSSIVPQLLQDVAGAIYPKWLCRSGDVMTLRNLPPVVDSEIDRIRTFVVAETAYQVDEDNLESVPELPLPSLEVLIARRSEGF